MLNPFRFARFLCLLTVAILAAPVSATTMYALTTTNKLVVFDSGNPGAMISAAVPADGIPFTGLQVGESVISIDFRPSTGDLYGVGNTMRLYFIKVVINESAGTATASATAVGGSFTTFEAARYGMDFNPAADRVRIVNNTEDNLRVNPFSGALVQFDTPLSPAGNVVECAYDRSFPGSTATTLYAIDSAINSLVLIGGVNGSPSPNGGVVTNVGPLLVDFTANAGLDFGGGLTLYALLRVGGVTGLYSITKNNGAATHLGNLVGNPIVNGLAVAPQLATLTKKSVKLNFAKENSDSISFSGRLDVPTSYIGIAPLDPTALVDVGGIRREFPLDENGRGALGTTDKIQLTIRNKNGVLSGTFKLSIKKSALASLLTDEGLTNEDVTNRVVRVPVSIFVNSHLFSSSPNVVMSYTAKAGKTGKAK